MLTTPLLSWWHHIGIHWNWFLGWWNPSLSTIKKCDGNNLDNKSSILKVRTSKAGSVELFFLLSGPVYSCAAYAAVYAMPTQPQWEPTRLIPLKVCLRRPNARVKRRRNVRFCLCRHTSVCFWKVGNGTFAYATTIPFTFLLSGYGTLHSLQQHERPGSKAPIDILQPHPAAAPAPRSQSAY